jgi:uncharacterized membrane protein
VTLAAASLTLASIAATAGFLVGRMPALPFLLPVHYHRDGMPDRWAFRSYGLVLMPVWVQIALAATFGAIVLLLVFRAGASDEPDATFGRGIALRMRATAEAVSLLALVWIAFQAVAAVQLTNLWLRGSGTFTASYNQVLVAAVVLSAVIAVRAIAVLRAPDEDRASAVPEHWRWRVLYFNPADPALFVPSRAGVGLTLNFGQRRAIALLVAVVTFGLGGPLLIMLALLR